MTEKTKELKQLQIGESIHYDWVDREYGRAEFFICPVFKRGYMTELFIDPKQQRTTEWFRLDLSNTRIRGLWFSSYCKPFGNEAWVWQTQWCKEHKCHGLELYVPRDSSRLELKISFGDTIHLEFQS